MTRTTILLGRWYDGDEKAFAELLEKHQGWILTRARNRLGTKLRQKLESVDVAQETILFVLEVTPRFKPKDGRQFRALMARIIENQIRDYSGWFAAHRRDIDREHAIPAGLSIDLTQPNPIKTPDEIAANDEMHFRIRFVLELLPAEERQIFLLRKWEDMPFKEIGVLFQISPDAARMRFGRAREKIVSALAQIRKGSFEAWLNSIEEQENLNSNRNERSGPESASFES